MTDTEIVGLWNKAIQEAAPKYVDTVIVFAKLVVTKERQRCVDIAYDFVQYISDFDKAAELRDELLKEKNHD